MKADQSLAAIRHILLQEAEFKLRMIVGFWNVLDLLAFFPPLLEACLLHGANVPFKLGRFDLRWFKILRCLPLCLQLINPYIAARTLSIDPL